ncbi:MAG TPA: sulfatase-like hydrolase/transferase, partial [Parafilimonas sp.]|nr:sulfatase-like hydrolase/transferase [Parafilimonas sp.]
SRSNNHFLSSTPNIIVILGDDVGYEIPTYTGGQSYSTTNIDYLAANGMQFSQCHSTPLCSPSRFMLLTGKYGFRNYTEWGIMDTSQRTFANMLRDAGYATCVVGKWQFNGGDQSIHKFGFDSYSIFDPQTSNTGDHDAIDPKRYKNAHVYQWKNSSIIDSQSTGYGPDISFNYARDFIDSANQPFLLYYASELVHPPFSPTPDDPEYASWNPDLGISDTSFYPSMVHYMDKLIGRLRDHLDSLGILNNTIILFVGDNGTSEMITSTFNGQSVRGGKSEINERGTHVPLIAYWPGTISPAMNGDLIDFTDFLPTVAGIAKISLPNYGPLDGVNFYPSLIGASGTPRSWIFTYYKIHPSATGYRIVQNSNTKEIQKIKKSGDTSIKYYFIPPYPRLDSSIKKSAVPKQIRSTFDSVLSVER